MTDSGNKLSSPQARLLLLLGLSVLINYVDRGNLSIAAPLVRGELNISTEHMGLLFSAFFATYAFSQPLAGWLVDRLDVGWVLAGGFFLWSVATAATGLVSGFGMLLAARLVLGVGESVAYPSYSKLLQCYFPEAQKGRANSVIAAGAGLGSAFGAFAGGILVASFGWRPFFVGMGAVTLLWLVPWMKWRPRAISPALTAKRPVPTLGEILSQRSAWGTFLGLLCSNYVLYFLITWLPSYLVNERNFSLQKTGLIGGLAYLAMASTALVCGWASDRWLASGATPSLVRKTVVGVGVIGSSLCVAASVVASPAWVAGALIVGGAFYGAASSSTWAISQTLAGSAAVGRWIGFKNFFGNLAGMIAPAITGIIVARTGHYYWAFLLTGFIGLLATFFWVFMVGPVRKVEWSTDSGSELEPQPVLS